MNNSPVIATSPFTHAFAAALALSSLAVVAGCGSDGGAASGTPGPTGPDPGAGPTYRADVRPILEAKCSGCHAPGGIAPFTLETFEEVHALRDSIKAAVSDRSMPPWLAADGCADYAGDRSLADEEIATLAAWADAGGPEGDADAEGDVGEAPRALSRVDRTLSMPEEYTATAEPDDYRCFLLDWPEAETSYVTGFRANPGNAQVVHHVIAFLIPPARVAEYAELDAKEAGPGYTCFGGPGGGNDPDVGWIGGWAPGSAGSDFPAGTGLEVAPGSKIALQVHYNTANGVAPDLTSIDVKVDASVERKAKWQFFTNFQWLLGQGMDIPAGAPDVHHAYSIDPTPFVFGGDPFVIHGVGLHMHTRGTSATLSIQRAAGGDECLLDIPRWDFHWQNTYDLVTPKLVEPGDRVAIGCSWDNSAGNQPMAGGMKQPPKDISWGEGTGDEMCLGTLYVSEP